MTDPKEKRVRDILDEAVGFGGHSAWLGSANITAVVRVLVERVAALEGREAAPVPKHPSENSGERNVCVICGQSGDLSICPNCDGDRGLVRYVRLDSPWKLQAELEAVKREADGHQRALGEALGLMYEQNMGPSWPASWKTLLATAAEQASEIKAFIEDVEDVKSERDEARKCDGSGWLCLGCRACAGPLSAMRRERDEIAERRGEGIVTEARLRSELEAVKSERDALKSRPWTIEGMTAFEWYQQASRIADEARAELAKAMAVVEAARPHSKHWCAGCSNAGRNDAISDALAAFDAKEGKP